MRYVFSLPLTAIVIALFNLVAGAGAMVDPESLIYDGVLPSTAEFFLKAGELLTAGGILLLILSAWRAMKCPSIAAVTAVLCVATAIVAIGEFVFVLFCGTPTFFFLMLLAITEAGIAIFAYGRARRSGI